MGRRRSEHPEIPGGRLNGQAPQGAPIPAVQQQLGHSNIAATSVYLHARPQALHDFMAARPPDLPPPM